MIGKTLYKAKVKDDKVIMESHTIVGEKRKYYYFGGVRKCLKSDVGVVCFLTQEEAIDYLVKRLKHSIEMGEKYIKKEKDFLEDTILFLEPCNVKQRLKKR